jgi:hypothetical protein
MIALAGDVCEAVNDMFPQLWLLTYNYKFIHIGYISQII